MNDQLTCVLITPYSLLKSRTGGIIGRLLSLSRGLDFVGARMYAPSDEFIGRYEETLEHESISAFAKDAIKQYLRHSLVKNNRFGISNRTMALLFRGENAVDTLVKHVIGGISHDVRGDTIRGTYGDLVTQHSGELEFFEPAVLAPTTEKANRKQLRILADLAMSDGGILEHVVQFREGDKPQTTLVIIKPDNFIRKSARPGNIIDMFSRTGLYIVGAKLMHMSEEQAQEFYGPLREEFVTKLLKPLAERIREALKPEFSFPISDEQHLNMAEVIADRHAEHEFRRIVNYMTGAEQNPWSCNEEESGKCLALLYQGINAIEKIRLSLGATNPETAEPGTVRSTYGHDLMKNGAHASDSPENAQRERRIVGLDKENDTCEFRELILDYLGED